MINNLHNVSLKYFAFYFLILQFILVYLSYIFFGSSAVSLIADFSSDQLLIILGVVSISNFCLIFLGFTLLAIGLDLTLIFLDDYDEGYKIILKILLLVSSLQIPQILLGEHLGVNINIYSLPKLFLDISFGLIGITFFGILVKKYFDKRKTTILILSLFILQVVSYIGLTFIVIL